MISAKSPRIYAFIDGNNLYLGAKSQNIKIDYRKLRLYLKNKLGVDKAFLFIGYDPERTALYSSLTRAGFHLIHKPAIIYNDHGKRTMKGNVDAELVLHCAAIEYQNYDQAVIVTSDGDFACLIKFLADRGKLKKIIATTNYYSSLFHPYTKFILRLSEFKNAIKPKVPTKKPAFAFGRNLRLVRRGDMLLLYTMCH